MRCRKSISTFARSLSRSRGHWVPIFLSGILQCFLLPQGQLAWLTCFNLDLPYEEMKGLSYPPHTLSGCLGNLYKGVEAETAALPSLTPTHRVNKGVWGGRVEYGKESVLSRTTASEKALRLARAGGSEEEIVASGAGAQGDRWAAVALRCLPSNHPPFLGNIPNFISAVHTSPSNPLCLWGIDVAMGSRVGTQDHAHSPPVTGSGWAYDPCGPRRVLLWAAWKVASSPSQESLPEPPSLSTGPGPGSRNYGSCCTHSGHTGAPISGGCRTGAPIESRNYCPGLAHLSHRPRRRS